MLFVDLALLYASVDWNLSYSYSAFHLSKPFWNSINLLIPRLDFLEFEATHAFQFGASFWSFRQLSASTQNPVLFPYLVPAPLIAIILRHHRNFYLVHDFLFDLQALCRSLNVLYVL